MTVNTERMVAEFAELVAIDAVSLHERSIKEVLVKKLKALGFRVEEDGVGELIGGDCGNLYCFLEGELDGPPLLFSGHMDTVVPGIGKRAVIHADGTITSDGTTVLGADNVACLVEIMEAIRLLREAGLPHRSVELVICVAEELHLLGSARFDCTKIQAKEGYTLDISGRVGRAAIAAPSVIAFTIEAFGKASHAGFDPEAGANAIAAMAELIAATPQGRLPEVGTFNIGAISGGKETNIISEYCLAKGEVRSFDHQKALRTIEELKERATAIGDQRGVRICIDYVERAHAYRIEPEAPVVQRFLRVSQRLGLSGELESTFGGSDNNVFVKEGLSGIVLSCGMYQVHSTAEYTRTEDLRDAALLVAGLLQEN